MSNQIAPSDSVFVCLACGKTSQDLYEEQKISPGWDESCMLNAQIFERKRLIFTEDGDTVVEVKAE